MGSRRTEAVHRGGATPGRFISSIERSAKALAVVEGASTNFFFSGFSEDWKRPAMWRFFRKFGNVMDVFVPQKGAKNGRRFGFVRYKEARDEQWLVDRVTEVWAGLDPLVLNKARFSRSRMESSPSTKLCSATKTYQVVPDCKLLATSQPQKFSSYADVVRRKFQTQAQASAVREEELSWLDRCLLAEAKSHELLNELSFLLEGAGFSNTKIKYVGGFRVLLECTSRDAAQKVLHDGLPTLSDWFSWVCPWSIEKETQRPGRLL